MKNNNQQFLKDLPTSVRKIMEHEPKDNPLYAVVRTDLDYDLNYRDGYLILSKEYLYVFQAETPSTSPRYFKGYGTRTEAMLADDVNYIAKKYTVEELEELHIEHQVACNLLIAKRNEEEIRIALFTNLSKKKVFDLMKTFKKLKKNNGEEPEKEPEKPEDEYCPKCGRMYPDRARKICPRCMNRKAIFFRVLNYFKPYRARIVVLMLIIVATAALNLVWPYLNGTVLYDKILGKDDAFLAKFNIPYGKYVLALLLVVLTMFMTKVVLLLLQIVQGIFTAKVVCYIVRDMKKAIFHVMGDLSISFFRSRQTGSLMTRVMSDADRVTGFFLDGCPYIFINGFLIIASTAVMLSINWQMTIVTIVMLPTLAFVSFYLRPKVWVMFGRRHRAERSLNNAVNDNLTGARVVKAFGQEARESKRFTGYNGKLQTAEVAISKQRNFFNVMYGGGQQIVTIVVWIMGACFLMEGKNMEFGTLITFIGYVGQLSGPMNFFSHIFTWWSDSMNSAERMFEIIDAVPEVREKEDPVRLPKPNGEIELKDVSFGYDENRPVLKNINFTIPAGSMLGIVGRSGAGKTTLVNLISRMYDPQEGSILIDGIDVKDLAFHDLRKNVAMVSQETYIFMGTIAENIAYADLSAKPEQIVQAAKLAGAHDFIMRLPDGYDTRIGASGRELSGGERQRISIARAILANPKILILDEATASVDTETERVIQKSIQYLVEGRTTISIAHRLSTLRDADYLIVIDNGKITERGTHQELIDLQGTYYKLMELQTKALAIKEV